MSWRETIGRYIAGGKQEIEDRDEDLKAFSYKINADKMLIYRLDAQWRFQMEQLDESMDIEDRVNNKIGEIEMIHKAWGRGADNLEWTIRYNAWKDLVVFWRVYVTRRAPEMRQLVMIEMEVELPLPDKPDNKMKVVRTVKARTAEALQRIHGDKVRIIKMLDPPASSGWKSAFSADQIELFCKREGEWRLEWGDFLSNWAFLKIDVTANTITVLHGTAPQMEQTQKIVATSKLRRQQASAAGMQE